MIDLGGVYRYRDDQYFLSLGFKRALKESSSDEFA